MPPSLQQLASTLHAWMTTDAARPREVDQQRLQLAAATPALIVSVAGRCLSAQQADRQHRQGRRGEDCARPGEPPLLRAVAAVSCSSLRVDTVNVPPSRGGAMIRGPASSWTSPRT